MKIEKRMPDLLNIVTHWNRRRTNPKHTNIARSIQISKFGEIIQRLQHFRHKYIVVANKMAVQYGMKENKINNRIPRFKIEKSLI